MPPRWARRLSVLLGPVGAVLLAACYGGAGRYRGASGPTNYRVDRDGDGSLGAADCRDWGGSPECARELENPTPDPRRDCDDNDKSRYPGAADMAGDGIDQNCDGVDGWRDPSVVVQPVNAVEPAPVPAEPPPGN